MDVSKGVNRSYASTHLNSLLFVKQRCFFGHRMRRVQLACWRPSARCRAEILFYRRHLFTESTFAGISNPETMVFDPSGNLFVGNGKANSIKKITPSGIKTTFATDLDVDGMGVDAFGESLCLPQK